MNQLILQYLEAKHQLAHFKKLEAELRIQVLDEAFPGAGEGTLNAVDGDFLIKGTFKNTLSIDRDVLADITASLSPEEADCISYQPKLSLAKYKALSEDERATLDECITSKPAMPTLEIKVED